jgi:nitroimidazol reductase NimA-like FMN-containing flavoprotein (pyridoxamine 5'-phosphate oxidase superfamily)
VFRFEGEGLEALSERECWELLATANIGRVGVTDGGLAVILPVNYLVDGDEILFLTNPGTKLDAVVGGQVVAFEVDSLDPDTGAGWSVHVVGRGTTGAVPKDGVLPTPWAGDVKAHLVRLRPEVLTGQRIHPT